MILAVDLGSTSFKAGVFDDVPSLRGSGSHPLRYRYGPGGCVELEAEEVASAFQHAIRAAIEEAHIPPEAIHALAVTSQAQTFTVVDATGRAKMPFISWQDTRARATCRMLERERALGDFAEHASFGQMLAVLQICQLAHLQTNRPGALAPEDRVFSLPTYLVHCCSDAAATDDNLAAMSGLYSLTLDDWWPAALEVCRIRREQLPEVVPVGSVAAYTGRGACQLGLPGGIPVVLAGNDQTAGAFGAELHEKGSLLITLGTAQVAYACVDGISASNPALIRGPYPGGLSYRMAADTCGGNVINWARSILPACETDSAFFARVDSAEPGCRGLVFDADLPAGEGAWRHVALHHTPDELARSIVEGLVRRMADMVSRLNVNRPDAKILVAGGGATAATWVKLLADTLGTPLVPTGADPLWGAARMALASDIRGPD